VSGRETKRNITIWAMILALVPMISGAVALGFLFNPQVATIVLCASVAAWTIIGALLIFIVYKRREV